MEVGVLMNNNYYLKNGIIIPIIPAILALMLIYIMMLNSVFSNFMDFFWIIAFEVILFTYIAYSFQLNYIPYTITFLLDGISIKYIFRRNLKVNTNTIKGIEVQYLRKPPEKYPNEGANITIILDNGKRVPIWGVTNEIAKKVIKHSLTFNKEVNIEDRINPAYYLEDKENVGTIYKLKTKKR